MYYANLLNQLRITIREKRRGKLVKRRKLVWEIAVHLAVAGGVYDGVFLCCPFLDEIFDLIESVFEGFPTYST